MSRRHALVVHTRMPAFDRDSGSQDIDHAIRWLLDAGWSVTFLAREEEGLAEQRHAERLRQMGVATFAGFGWAPKVLSSSSFDLALVAFWELAEEVLPVIRQHSPPTRVVVNSMDVHFLRLGRQLLSQSGQVGPFFGKEAARELTVYHQSDAVVAVSDKERTLLADFLGEDRVFTLPLAERVERSTVPLEDRRGAFFVGNFRHIPNREAVEWLAGEVLPLLEPELLERHPVAVIGNWLQEAKLAVDPSTPGLQLIGWVPSLRPYVERSRAAIVPLLHGAGVKRKVLQSMMAYTPVVTTPVGAEGLELVQGRHALIASDAPDMAAGLTRLLTDDVMWGQLADAGAEHVDQRHSIEVVRERFTQLVETVMARPARAPSHTDGQDRGATAERPADAAAIRRRIQMIAEPGQPVLMVSLGDAALVEIGSQPCWHFPQDRDGGWAGFDPVSGPAAVNHLEAQRERGARYFVLPAPAFSWRHRYPELHEHLESTGRRVHQDEAAAIYDLAPVQRPELALDGAGRRSVLVVGTHAAQRTGPPLDLLQELSLSEHLDVRQVWRPAGERHGEEGCDPAGADYVVHIDDNAVLPAGFLDELVATQERLRADRVQPAHTSGPSGGPPVTERHRGVVARQVDAVTPLPVLSVRTAAEREGPVVLTDTVTVGLRRPLTASGDPEACSWVRRLWTAGADGQPERHDRPEPAARPRISVLISTFNRPDLLRGCLESFCEQTLDREDYEVVVVDDGSDSSEVDAVVGEFSDRLQVFGLRIGHAGRSAAKNVCVLLSRAPIVLFFDDDDRASPDYLERHLARHERRPGEGVAVLGHTRWAPELDVTPLMHFATDVDRLMFAYASLTDGQELNWKGFWEGRISAKRSFLVRHALHDQRLAYSIDVEMGWRLMPLGLRVVYDASAVSVMARAIDFEDFCARTQAKGRALAVIAALHPGSDIGSQLALADTISFWEDNQFSEAHLRRRVAELEEAAATDDSVLPELHDAYRSALRLMQAKGVVEATEGAYAMPREAVTVPPFPGTDPEFLYDRSPQGASGEPVLSISLPVWSRSQKLAEMARSTIERVWEVARVPTEVIAVDNGSPFEVPLPAKVYRYAENRGVATGWNTGIRLSSAPVVVVMNSDCRVEPGWDEALMEAATDGRRVAFPYTDNCDGRGFTMPDQGGTSGWCFMMTKELYEEVGVFDEWFNPAFCEDTDYWHRAWQLGVELSPVPAARVVHARRTTASTHPQVDWLLLGHRYKYGWKHGVDPLAAPPYYNRRIVEYCGKVEPPASG